MNFLGKVFVVAVFPALACDGFVLGTVKGGWRPRGCPAIFATWQEAAAWAEANGYAVAAYWDGSEMKECKR